MFKVGEYVKLINSLDDAQIIKICDEESDVNQNSTTLYLVKDSHNSFSYLTEDKMTGLTRYIKFLQLMIFDNLQVHKIREPANDKKWIDQINCQRLLWQRAEVRRLSEHHRLSTGTKQAKRKDSTCPSHV